MEKNDENKEREEEKERDLAQQADEGETNK